MQIKPEEFCRWLQGFAELTEGVPTENQWKSIKEHLQKVFEKITPPVENINPSLKDLTDKMVKGMKEQPSPFKEFVPFYTLPTEWPKKRSPQLEDFTIPPVTYCKADAVDNGAMYC